MSTTINIAWPLFIFCCVVGFVAACNLLFTALAHKSLTGESADPYDMLGAALIVFFCVTICLMVFPEIR